MIDLGLESIPVQLVSGAVTAKVCSKRVWEQINHAASDTDVTKACRALICGALPPLCERRLFLTEYIDAVNHICEECDLKIPYYPEKDKDDVKYYAYTAIDKMVADYANMSIYDIDKISIFDYRLLQRDAFISVMLKTKDGREYLKNAYRLTVEEADEDLEI